MQEPKFDNVRRLRDIHVIDPDIEEFKETIKNAKKKLKVLVEAALLCKMGRRKRVRKLRESVTSDNTNSHNKTKYA